MKSEKFDFKAVFVRKKKVVKPLAALTFFSLAAFNVYISVKPEEKSSDAKREKALTPLSVIDYGCINENRNGHEFESSSEFERIRDNLGITNTRGIKKDIVLKTKSLLIVDANAGGLLLGNFRQNNLVEFPNNGWVIAKIRIDGNDWVMNTSTVNSHLLHENGRLNRNTFTDISFPLYSSVSFQKVLDRGEHKIEAIGLFCGNFEHPDIKLNYSGISVEPIQLISQLDTGKDKEKFLYLRKNESIRNERNESAKNSVLPDNKIKSKASLIMNTAGKRFETVDPLIYRERLRDVFDLALKSTPYLLTSCHRYGYLS